MTLSIERRARLWGDRTAIVDESEDRVYSYADLANLAETFARRLAGIGVDPGDTVAVVSRTRVETLALVFAVHRLGAALAPISNRPSKAEIAALVERIDPAVVCYERAQEDHVRLLSNPQPLAELREEVDAEYEPREPGPNDPLLYVETREDDPRIVEMPVRQVEWNCITETAAWGLGDGDTGTSFVQWFRADGLLVLALPLLYVGGRVVIRRAFRPKPILSAVQRLDITHAYGTPREYGRLADAERFERADLSRVEWFLASRPLPSEVGEAFRSRGHEVGRVYGTAAAGPNALYFAPDRSNAGTKPDGVGRPFPDCAARVIDDRGDPVAPGEVGALEVAGPVTASGMLDGDGFGRWVETGGRVREDDDGDYVLVE